jgi:hypothetical protein
LLIRLDHVSSRIVNADHSIMRSAAKLRAADCVWFAVPQLRRDRESQTTRLPLQAAQVMHPTSSTLIRNSSLRLLEIDSPASGYLNLYSGLPASIQ